MRHAGPEALDRLEPLLAQLREFPTLTEKSRGAFYRSGRALLHFHEDGTELFADVHVGEEWERCRVMTQRERSALLRTVRRHLGG